MGKLEDFLKAYRLLGTMKWPRPLVMLVMMWMVPGCVGIQAGLSDLTSGDVRELMALAEQGWSSPIELVHR